MVSANMALNNGTSIVHNVPKHHIIQRMVIYKKNKCEKCGFVPEDKCQLDIVYKDDNKKNKEKTNMKTLCANCNRLHQKKMKEKKKSILDITIDADVVIS